MSRWGHIRYLSYFCGCQSTAITDIMLGGTPDGALLVMLDDFLGMIYRSVGRDKLSNSVVDNLAWVS